MSAMFNYTRDINSYSIGNALPLSDTGFQFEVKASNGATVTVPSKFNNYVAKITCNQSAEIWVSNAAITLSTDNTVTASSAQIIPQNGMYIFVPKASSLVFATANASFVGVSVAFYAVNN